MRFDEIDQRASSIAPPVLRLFDSCAGAEAVLQVREINAKIESGLNPEFQRLVTSCLCSRCITLTAPAPARSVCTTINVVITCIAATHVQWWRRSTIARDNTLEMCEKRHGRAMMSKIFGACGGPRERARSARKRQKFSGSLRSPGLIFRISDQIESLFQILGQYLPRRRRYRVCG